MPIDFQPEIDFVPENGAKTVIDFQPEEPSVNAEAASIASSQKRSDLVKQMQTERMKGMFAESLANVASAVEGQAKALAHPIQTIEKGVEAAATLITGSPKELTIKPSEIMQRPLAKIPAIPEQQSRAAKAAAGVGNAVIDFANFMQTPEGVGMLGIGALPAALQRGVTLAISAQMAASAPESFANAVDAAKAGDVQTAAKHATEFLGGTALSALAAGHATGKPTIAEKLVSAEAPMTAEAVKDTPLKDEVPIVDLDKLKVVPPESVGLPPLPKAEPMPEAPKALTAPPMAVESLKETVSTGAAETPSAAEKAAGNVVEPGPGQGVTEPSPGPAPKPVTPRRPSLDRPWDIIDEIENSVGRIRGKKSAKAGSEGYYGEGYETAKKAGAARALFSNERGQSPDEVVDTLRRSGHVPEDFTVDDLWDALKKAATSRKMFRTGISAEGKEIAKQEIQTMDFESRALRSRPGTEPVNVSELVEGDEFQMAGVNVKVKELVIDRETGELSHLVLEDGRRFGVQTVGANQTIHPDKGTLKTEPKATAPTPVAAPKLRPMENQGELLGAQDPFNLAGEQGIDPERIAGEKAQAEATKQAAKEFADKNQETFTGMGGAVPSEFVPAAQTPTSIKNATVDQERVKRGLPPAMQPTRRTFGAVWDQAMAKIDQDPEYPDRLLDELRKNPRALTDLEDATLLHRQIELQNEYGKATRDLAQAFDDGRMDDVGEQKARVAGLSDQLLDIYNIGKAAGTETGRGLAARRMMAHEDFSLAKMELEKRAAKGGEPLTDAERAEVTELNRKIEATQKAYDDYVARTEDRFRQMEIDRAYREVTQQQPVLDQRAKSLAERIVKALEKQANDSREYLRGKLFTISPDVLFHLSRIGAAQIARGVLEFSRWSGAMVGEFGERIQPYLREVFDASNKLLDATAEAVVGKKEATRARRAVTGEEAGAKQAEITERLKEAFGKNDMAAVTPLAQKLARLFVEQGVKSRDALVDAVHGVLKEISPELTRRQAMDAISGYGDFKQLTKDEISVQLRDLKGQLQQVAKLEDIQGRKPPLKTGLERRSPSDEERRLIKLVNEAKRRFGIVVTDPATQLKSALEARKTYYRNQITDLEKQIAAKEKFIKEKSASPTDPELEGLKARSKQLRSEFDDIFGKPERTEAQQLQALKSRLKSSIAKMQDQLKRGDFSKRVPVKPTLDAEAQRLSYEAAKVKAQWHEALIKDRLARRSIPQKILGTIGEVLNTSRAILTSLDLSAVLRQGGFIAFGHPIRALKAFPAMFKALRSEAGQHAVNEEIVARKNYPLYQQSKLYLSKHGQKLSDMEEAYMSRWSEKIPLVGASERAYVTFLNKLRADSFDAMVNTLTRDGTVTPHEAKAIANFINVATGRGKVGLTENAGVGLATVFFAPRYVASRFQLIAGQPLYRGSLRTRKLVAMEYARFLAGAGVVYGLGVLAGGDVEQDPRSSDFGKLRFGDTRIDPMAGLLQPTVLLSRLASGETKRLNGAVVPIRGPGIPFGGQDAADVTARFLRTKLSPVVGTSVNLLSGKDVVGQPVTPATVAQGLLVPLALQDIYSAMVDQGVPKGTAMAILSIFGMSIQTFHPAAR